MVIWMLWQWMIAIHSTRRLRQLTNAATFYPLALLDCCHTAVQLCITCKCTVLVTAAGEIPYSAVAALIINGLRKGFCIRFQLKVGLSFKSAKFNLLDHPLSNCINREIAPGHVVMISSPHKARELGVHFNPLGIIPKRAVQISGALSWTCHHHPVLTSMMVFPVRQYNICICSSKEYCLQRSTLNSCTISL